MRALDADLTMAQGGGADIYARYKITTEALEQIYQHDLNLVTIADQLPNAASSGNLDQINSLIEQIRNILFQRQQLFFPPEAR